MSYRPGEICSDQGCYTDDRPYYENIYRQGEGLTSLWRLMPHSSTRIDTAGEHHGMESLSFLDLSLAKPNNVNHTSYY